MVTRRVLRVAPAVRHRRGPAIVRHGSPSKYLIIVASIEVRCRVPARRFVTRYSESPFAARMAVRSERRSGRRGSSAEVLCTSSSAAARDDSMSPRSRCMVAMFLRVSSVSRCESPRTFSRDRRHDSRRRGAGEAIVRCGSRSPRPRAPRRSSRSLSSAPLPVRRTNRSRRPQVPFVTNAAGQIPGLIAPVGAFSLEAYLQFVIADPAAVQGVALSNALKLVAP